jgi:hypothetical protein
MARFFLSAVSLLVASTAMVVVAKDTKNKSSSLLKKPGQRKTQANGTLPSRL